MKKFLTVFLLLILAVGLCGFDSDSGDEEDRPFDIDDLTDYQKEFESEEISVCSIGKAKTYMDYRAVTATGSRQYWYIHNFMTVDPETGFLYDEDGFIGVALGSFYGVIGDRYYFTLDSGIVLPLVKVEEKADIDTDASGCYHYDDGSVIEFVIDKNAANSYFGYYENGLVLSGNYNNYELFRGSIASVEKVMDVRKEDYVTFEKEDDVSFPETDIFDYASGY